MTKQEEKYDSEHWRTKLLLLAVSIKNDASLGELKKAPQLGFPELEYPNHIP